MLYIFSGLPGTGKTTLAQKLSEKSKAIYISIDALQHTFRSSECNIHISEKTDFIARWTLARETGWALANENLKCGNNVVADSVNPVNVIRQKWRDVAIKADKQFTEIYILCSDITVHKARIDARKNNNGFWQRVQNQEYEPWTKATIHIDTASANVEQSFDELCSKLSLNA